MKFVEEGEGYRIFSGRRLGILPYYLLEDSRESTRKDGVDFNVKFTYFYFKTLKQIRKVLDV